MHYYYRFVKVCALRGSPHESHTYLSVSKCTNAIGEKQSSTKRNVTRHTHGLVRTSTSLLYTAKIGREGLEHFMYLSYVVTGHRCNNSA